MEGKIRQILDQMSAYLDQEQLQQLKETLYIVLHKEEKQEIAVCDGGNEQKLKLFLGSKATTGRKAGTLKQYEMEIRRMLDFIRKNIEDVTAMDLRYYFAVRRRHGLSLASMQSRIHYLNSFWSFLQNEGVVQINPVAQIGNVLAEKRIKKPFTPEELEKLRAACHTLRDRALIEFLYSTGVRVSEAVSIDRADVDFAKNQLTVFGKGAKERTVYITDVARYHLQKYLAERTDTCPALFACQGRRRRRISVVGVQYMLRQLGKAAGVSRVHPHRFRRTMATDLLSRGMRIESVKELLGHTKLDTTMIYCSIKQDNVRNDFLKYA